MQRIGRVNRIGSRADRIYVYNYYPSAYGDAQIHLVNNALRKLQAFHTALVKITRYSLFSEEKGRVLYSEIKFKKRKGRDSKVFE